MDPSMKDLLQRQVLLISWTSLVWGFTTASSFAHFLDPSIYVVTIYEIMGGGDFYQSRELSPRFARRQQ